MHTSVYGEVVPDERQHEDSAQYGDGVIHACRARLWRRRKQEDDVHEHHEGDRNDGDGETLYDAGLTVVSACISGGTDEYSEVERTRLEVVLEDEPSCDWDTICNVECGHG